MVETIMKVREVDTDSPLFGHVRSGDTILTINGLPVLDAIDFHFRATDEQVQLVFADRNGRELNFQFEGLQAGALGLTFADDRVRVCNCDCIFCFIRQQPKGMRRALYVRDEDYRLSFTHGNFITLSNVTKKDINRIIEQRLSPLYVSVHATDNALRRRMLGNRKLKPIVPSLRHLAENGITLHTQVVLCPGINDGPQLEKTIDDLAQLYSGVATLAIVPVGLTRYRGGLPRLRTHTQDEARDVIELIERNQKKLFKSTGTRFVWAADEFYVIAGREFPSLTIYEEMSQFENGVGMMREFISGFNRRRRFLKGIRSRRNALFITGHSAYGFLSRHVVPYVRDQIGLKLTLLPVVNRFWGDFVTVSGLLTGDDILREVRERVGQYDTFVLPPNCLNGDGLFLDDMSLERFESELGKPVITGSYNLAETIREVYG